MTSRRPGLALIRLLLRIVETGPARLWLAFGLALTVTFALWLHVLHAQIVNAAERTLVALTFTVQMILLAFNPNDFPANPDAELGLGIHLAMRAMALLLPILASAGIIRTLFHERLRPLLFRRAAAKAEGYPLVIGAGRMGSALVQASLADPDQATVGVVEASGYGEYYADLFHGSCGEKLLWIGGDARRGGTLSVRGSGRPRRVYLTAGGGQNNLGILDALVAQRSDDVPPTGPLEVLVGLNDHLQQEVLEGALARQRALDPTFSERFWVRGFHLEALAARRAFQSLWPMQASREARAVVVLIGDSSFAVELLDQFARLGHFDPVAKPRVRWVVPPGSKLPARLLARNRGLDAAAGGGLLAASIHPALNLEIVEHDLVCLSAGMALNDTLVMDGGFPQRVFLCTGRRELNEWLAQCVRRELLRAVIAGDDALREQTEACRVVAAIERGEDFDLEDGEDARSLRKQHRQADPQGWEHFEVLRAGIEALRRDHDADLLAMLAARTFDRIYAEAGTGDSQLDALRSATLAEANFNSKIAAFFGLSGTSDATLGTSLYGLWSRCGAEERWANRDNVDHIALKIAAVAHRCGDADLAAGLGALIGRLGNDAAATARWSAVQFDALTAALGAQLERAIGPESDRFLLRVEHRRWAAFKLANGWRLGARSAAARLNPTLVDFDALDAREQDKDALFVRLIPLLLRILWQRRPDWQA